MVEHINRWDGRFSYPIYAAQSRRLFVAFMYWISRSGDGYLYGPLVALLILLNLQTGLNILICTLMAFVLELPLYVLVKRSVKRPRPFEVHGSVKFLIKPPDKFSFPSGHTAGAFLVSGVLSYFIPAVLVFVFIWALMVGISRIVLGVHYPSDVLAGAILGLGAAFAAIALV